MTPEIINQPLLLLAGVIASGKGPGDIDIRGLWNAYHQAEPGIDNRIDGTWYELHIGEKLGNGIYSVLTGIRIENIGHLPVEISLKIIPAGKYAHFAHCMKDGGFGEAFAQVEAWVKESKTPTKDFGLQLYDSNFNPSDKNSILHIYIPLDE